MKTVTMELRGSSSLLASSAKRQARCASRVRGPEDKSVEGQLAMRARVPEGTNFAEGQKTDASRARVCQRASVPEGTNLIEKQKSETP